MEIVKRSSRMKSVMNRLRAERKKIGFVPTMGALHEGHLSLIQQAGKIADAVVLSIFVNPTQFGPNEDFERYPRDLPRDADYVSTMGVDYIYAPTNEDIYPPGFSTYVNVEGLGDVFCGRSRPGHLRGVATVMTIFFNVVRPDFVFLSQRDYQHSVIIRQLVRDLHMDAEVVVCPAVREPDGLVASSRNVYLNPEERRAATVIYRSLMKAAAMVESGERNTARIIEAIREVIQSEPLAQIDYTAVVDPDTLEPVDEIGSSTVIAMVAAFIGATRLVDNIFLNPPMHSEGRKQ